MFHLEVDEPLYATGTKLLYTSQQKPVEVLTAECDVRLSVTWVTKLDATAIWRYKVRTLVGGGVAETIDRVPQDLLIPLKEQPPATTVRVTRTEEAVCEADPT